MCSAITRPARTPTAASQAKGQIILTGYDKEEVDEDVSRCLGNGINAHIGKPFTLWDIYECYGRVGKGAAPECTQKREGWKTENNMLPP